MHTLNKALLDCNAIVFNTAVLGKVQKQVMKIQHRLVKKPIWLEADHLAIYRRRRGIEAQIYRVTNPVGGQGGN